MAMSIEAIEDYLEDSDAQFLEPRACYDEAILGLAEQAGGLRVVAYDVEKCILASMRYNGWHRDQAVDWFEFNTATAYRGPGTPIFVSVTEPALA